MSDPGDFGSARDYDISASAKFNAPGVDETAASFTTLTTAITTLQTALGGLTNKLPTFASKISDELKKITSAANDTTAALTGVGTTAGTFGSASVRGTPVAGVGSSSAPAWAQTPVSPSAANQNASTATTRPSGIDMSGVLQAGGNAAVTALSWIRDRINTNRNTAIQASGTLAMVGQQQGTSSADLMKYLGNNTISGMMGSSSELTNLFAALPQYGASVNFGGTQGGQGRRAVGFLAGLQQMQAMNPMANVSDLTQTLGNFSSDVGAQKTGQMLTGGAFSIIGSGGKQKSLSQWADSILKWLEGLRPGSMRNKPFTYGDLMAQYWPGSNIDAWFNATGVSEGMKSYWWTYVLAKAQNTDPNWQIGAEPDNVAANRLKSTTVLSQTELGLAGQMSGAYANREQVNTAFNSLVGGIQQRLLPAASGIISKIPDPIEDLLFSLLNKATGDVGDLGQNDFGSTSLAGLHPDMKSKVGAMMRANPNVRITSSMRNEGAQARLKNKGYSNVSGKSSAHTRGQAADLGPRSQYGWIARNAKKFGMSSGVGVGEPWHVGMPGIGDITDDINTALNAVLPGDNFDISDPMAMITSLFSKLFGMFGGTSATPEVKYIPNLPNPFTGIMSAIGKGTFGSSSSGSSSTGTTASGPASQSGLAAARALYNAGFKTRSDLEEAVAISWRESKWNPGAINPNTSDRGLMQINMAGNAGLMASMGYHEADLLDIQKNANIAYKAHINAMSSSPPGGWWPWGLNDSGVWDRNGNPLARTQGSNAADVVKQSGLPVIGDVERMTPYQPMPQQVGGSAVSFNNVFHISGGGGNSGIDARQTAKLVADHLETEMKQRLARTN